MSSTSGELALAPCEESSSCKLISLSHLEILEPSLLCTFVQLKFYNFSMHNGVVLLLADTRREERRGDHISILRHDLRMQCVKTERMRKHLSEVVRYV